MQYMQTVRYVNGPYENARGRRNVHVVFADGTSKHMSHARYVAEQAIGRQLTVDEAVDHMDENPLNDHVSNLAIVSHRDNKRASSEAEWFYFSCPICGKPSKKRASTVRHNWRRSPKGPYCSRSCGARAGHMLSTGKTEGEFVSERASARSWKSIVETHAVPADYEPTYKRLEHPVSRRALCTKCGEPLSRNNTSGQHRQCKEVSSRAQRRRERASAECVGCGKKISEYAERCKSCAAKMQKTRIEWPSDAELRELVRLTSYAAAGRAIGVSDNAIRHRLKKNLQG